MARLEEVVEEVIKKLIEKEYMRETKDMMYKNIGKRLYEYYEGKKDEEIKLALKELKKDKYFRVLPMYYRDKQKIEKIAEEMGVEVSTVTRNKKRMCISIYTKINGLQ